MSFVCPRGGLPPRASGFRRAAAACLALGAAAAVTVERAAAAPLDEPFVGGMSFSGPTSGNVAAVYWNPAALGLVRGVQLMIAASGRYAVTRVDRAAIDPVTGLPAAGGVSPGSATARDFSHPANWPIGPGGFVGIAWDLGSDRVGLAFATYMPSVQQIKFPTSPTGAEPTRYHLLAADIRNLALVPALSIRLSGELRIGIAPGFLFSTGRLAFAEDLAGDCGGVPCPAESPEAAARYDVNSGSGLGDAKFSLTLGGGIYYRRRSVEMGLAYQSRPIGSDVLGVEVAGGRSSVMLPPRDGGGPLTCPQNNSARCVFGDLSYRLPDIWIAGVTLHPTAGVEVTATVRWLWLHLHDRIDVRLTGPTVDAAGLPQHVVLYRGFKDVWDTRVRVAYWWRERVRVGAGLRVQTSAVDAEAISPGAVDGLTLQPTAMVEARLTRRLSLGAGYGLALMREVSTTTSRFDPTLAGACTMAQNDLETPACQQRLAGRARPTAAGTYNRTVHDFGLTATVRF